MGSSTTLYISCRDVAEKAFNLLLFDYLTFFQVRRGSLIGRAQKQINMSPRKYIPRSSRHFHRQCAQTHENTCLIQIV